MSLTINTDNSAVYPLDTVKTRLQALPAAEVAAETKEAEGLPSGAKKQRKRGPLGALISKVKRNQMIAMLVRIIRTEGVSGVFKGFSANMLNTFSMRECSNWQPERSRETVCGSYRKLCRQTQSRLHALLRWNLARDWA